MVNALRGEVEAVIDGQNYTLCLTLGALAELEAALHSNDLNGLAERFENGRVSARDLIAIIGAGLRGAGNPVSNEDLARMSIDGGASRAAQLAASLLAAAFGDPQPNE